jgi:hypothetical protein
MRKAIGVTLGAALLTLGAFGTAEDAHAQAGVKVGVLSCNVSSGFGFVFGSSRSVNCDFSPSPSMSEHYTGDITKFGVDIGYLQSSVMVWAVLAPSPNLQPGALAGQYAGVTGSAAVGPGVGANVLVGGSNKSITLQPISIEGQTGLNVAAGIAALGLTPAK